MSSNGQPETEGLALAAERAERARRAAIIRWCPQARQEHVYQRLVAAAAKAAPPLTPEQKDRLAALLNSDGKCA